MVKEFLDKFDVILDSSDPDFADELAKALGVESGGTLRTVTPQFDRTDGRAITYLPNTEKEYAALHLLSKESLIKIGCQIWSVKEEETHWLYPPEWYEHIPDGFDVASISGDTESFEPGKTDDDRRGDALAFGFIQTR